MNLKNIGKASLQRAAELLRNTSENTIQIPAKLSRYFNKMHSMCSFPNPDIPPAFYQGSSMSKIEAKITVSIAQKVQIKINNCNIELNNLNNQLSSLNNTNKKMHIINKKNKLNNKLNKLKNHLPLPVSNQPVYPGTDMISRYYDDDYNIRQDWEDHPVQYDALQRDYEPYSPSLLSMHQTINWEDISNNDISLIKDDGSIAKFGLPNSDTLDTEQRDKRILQSKERANAALGRIAYSMPVQLLDNLANPDLHTLESKKEVKVALQDLKYDNNDENIKKLAYALRPMMLKELKKITNYEFDMSRCANSDISRLQFEEIAPEQIDIYLDKLNA